MAALLDSAKLRLLKARLAYHQGLYRSAHSNWEKWKQAGDTAHYWHDFHESQHETQAAAVNQRQIERAREQIRRYGEREHHEAGEVTRYVKAIAALEHPPNPAAAWEAWLAKRHPETKAAIRRVIAQVLVHFPDIQITATISGTHASHSYHYTGDAYDLAYPMTSEGIAKMNEAGSWISAHLATRLAEGIHRTTLSVKNGQYVAASFWGEATWAGHANHIHLAAV